MRSLLLLSLVLLGACGTGANRGAAPAPDAGGVPSGPSGDGAIRPVSDAPFEMTALSILAPGQSGDFSTAEFAAAQALENTVGADPSVYGAHVDDQRLMYWNSQFKDGRFLDISGREIDAEPRPGARIYRDDFGVPVIHGDTLEDVWFAAGYALAVDRLFLLDGARRQGRGTLSEIAGPGSVPFDVQVRTLTYSEAEYQTMFDNLSDEAQRTILAYIEGSNLRINEVNTTAIAELPAEFTLLTYQPQPLTVADVLAIGVLITRSVAAAGGDEFANVAELQRLEAEFGRETALQIFSDVLWVDDKQATVTVPVGQEFSNISTPPAERPAVLAAMADFALGLPLDLATGPGTGDFPEPGPLIPVAAKNLPRFPDLRVLPEQISASYQVVISPERSTDGSTLLINGPQLGYSYPSLLAELEVHGPGFDARGTTVPGLPTIGIGYTERTAWALTTGESKTIDSFIEVLGDDPNTYMHNGELKNMDCRAETVTYRETAGPLPVGPNFQAVPIEVCRTLHGPVVARSAAGDLARSVQYGMWQREAETADAIFTWNRIDNFADFDASMRKATWNENLMYADADGNVAYYHPGLHPKRHPGTDQRLPIPGTGEFDHDGHMPFEALPQSRNPAQGWLANWNNKPAHGWGEGTGGDASQEPAAADGRIANWHDLLRNDQQMSIEKIIEYDRRIGLIDPRARNMVPIFLRLQGSPDLSANEQAVLDLIAAWDQHHYNPAMDLNDPEARDRPGETAFGALVAANRSLLVDGILGANFQQRHNRRGNHPYDAGTFDKLFVRIFNPQTSSITAQYDWLQGRSQTEYLRVVLAAAVAQLESDYGSDPAGWTRIHARAPIPNLTGLVGPSLSMPHQDRGSWIHVIGFKPGP